jgi:hypothetical protein
MSKPPKNRPIGDHSYDEQELGAESTPFTSGILYVDPRIMRSEYEYRWVAAKARSGDPDKDEGALIRAHNDGWRPVTVGEVREMLGNDYASIDYASQHGEARSDEALYERAGNILMKVDRRKKAILRAQEHRKSAAALAGVESYAGGAAPSGGKLGVQYQPGNVSERRSGLKFSD